MERRYKERIFGGVVLLSLAVIVIPMILDAPGPHQLNLEKNLPNPFDAVNKEKLKREINHFTQKQPTHVTPVQGPVTQDAPFELGKAWVIQLAAFANPQNASKLKKELVQKGYPVYLHSPTDNPTLTQVMVGPYIEKAKLEKLQATLNKRFKLSGVVKPYDPNS